MSTLKVGGIRGVSASSDAITIANDGTCTANITSNGGSQLANRNKIINGAMQVAQRGTSFTPSGTDNTYIVDRFQHIGTSGIDYDSTDTQSTDHPDGFSFSFKTTPDSTHTPTGSANAVIQHKIEGQDMQDLAYGTSSAKQITLSFYAKSSSQNNGHQYGAELAHYATDGTRRLINASFTITSSWQRFTFTFDGDTAHDIINSNARGFDVNIHLASGSSDIATHTSWTSNSLFRTPTGQSNFLDNTSNEFYITGVQLEVGSVATDFEHRLFGDELHRCFRYYQRIDGSTSESIFGVGNVDGANQGQILIQLPVPLRVKASSMDTTGSSGDYKFRVRTTQSCDSVPTLLTAGFTHQFLEWQANGHGFSDGDAALAISGSSSSFLAFSAEL